MIFRAGFFIVALVSAIKVRQLNNNRSRKPRTSSDKHGKVSFQEEKIEQENGKFEESHVEPREKKKEQAKTCKSKSVDKLGSNRSEFSVHEKKGENVREIDFLKNVVMEKEKMRERLEIRLIELYCLKEQQSRIDMLLKQLQDKIGEMDMLRGMIEKLQAERKALYEEVKQNQLAAEQLKTAELKILELQANKELDAGQMEGHLMMLNEQVLSFCVEGESKVHNKADKKLKAMKNVELKVMEIKRRNIELQLEKRELIVKLNAEKAKIAALSSMTEHKLLAQYQEEISKLKHVNNDLRDQVDKLHGNRFKVLEELVYQRWLNRCLRFEVEDYRSPPSTKPKPNVRRKSNFLSDSNSSEISSAESDEVTKTTITSSSSSQNTKNKKNGLIQKIKKFGRSKDNSSANASQSESRSLLNKAGLIRRFSTSSMPSSISGLRIRGDSGVEKEAPQSSSREMSPIRRVRRVSFNDSINSVRYIYNDSPESVPGVSNIDDKNAESFSDCLDMKTSSDTGAVLEEKNAEMPLSTVIAQSHEGSRDQSNRDNTEPQVVRRKEIVQAQCLSSEMANAASWTSKFGEVMNIIAAFILVFFVVLVYFRHVFAFKA